MGIHPRRWNVIAFAADATLFPLARLRIDSDFVRTDQPVVFVSNHRSVLDSLAGFAVFRRLGVQPSALVAARFFRNPVLGVVLRQLGAIPAGREPGEAISLATEAIAVGSDVAIMVQGRLTDAADEGDLARTMRGGAARLALDTGCLVVPMWAEGAERIWPKDRRLPRPSVRRKQIVVRVGHGLPVVGLSVADANRIIAQTLLALARQR